ncbi:MAG: hypothetical protein HY791_01130 [Deltaproteobacteria bacterium]|nr:hypothetical protein [Deltaproteobacteria bacterium]
MSGRILVQANHHATTEFAYRNEPLDDADPETNEMSRLAYSEAREAALKEALQGLGGTSTIDDVAACLDVEPVCNDESYQQMVFVPETGKVKVWRWAR